MNSLRRLWHVRLAVVGFGLTSLSLNSSYAFGGPGHSYIGATAEARLAKLSPDALKQVHALLGGLSLDRVATIPDQIRTWDQLPPAEKALAHVTDIKDPFGKAVGITWPAALRQAVWEYFQKNLDPVDGQPRHHVYHYTDIAIAPHSVLTYNFNGSVEGESDTDIVHTLVHCVAVLHDNKPDVQRGITPAIAVILICHLVGDLHQPLHVGAEYFATGTANPIDPNGLSRAQFASDNGGNGISIPLDESVPNDRHPERVIAGAQEDNLHSFWDKDTVAVAFEKLKVPKKFAGTSYMKQLVAAAPKSGWIPATGTKPETYFSGWAAEILPIAQEAHSRLAFEVGTETKNGRTRRVIEVVPASANATYLNWAASVIGDEMVKAGYRLAWVLQQSLPKKPA